MSPSTKVFAIPGWLKAWLRQIISALGLEARQLVWGTFRGIYDTLLLLLLGAGFVVGGRAYMGGQYALPRETQTMVLKWAPIADRIARQADIPREVPLVIWFKENSMQAVNPELCTGIMGVYDLVRSGEHACFPPGPISDSEVIDQLVIGSLEFKKRCPDITYFTQSPEPLKRCYLAYNAGISAPKRLDPDLSAYVMNNYDEAHTAMIYSDVELGTVQVTALGAWPVHLAIQSLIVSQWDEGERPFPITLIDLSTRLYDWSDFILTEVMDSDRDPYGALTFPADRKVEGQQCIGDGHIIGRLSLRPKISPVAEAQILTQDLHGCEYGLPGLDISSENSKAVLRSPIPGQLTTYTDQWFNTTIRIENDEWIIWLLHPRSFLLEEGTVKSGQSVGVMGDIGNATGPHVHYSVYDKVNENFVDPRIFFP